MKKTICVNCKHFIDLDPGCRAFSAYRCAASPREKATDPVTGNTRYILIVGFGPVGPPVGPSYTSHEFAECATINTHGNCDLYEAKS